MYANEILSFCNYWAAHFWHCLAHNEKELLLFQNLECRPEALWKMKKNQRKVSSLVGFKESILNKRNSQSMLCRFTALCYKDIRITSYGFINTIWFCWIKIFSAAETLRMLQKAFGDTISRRKIFTSDTKIKQGNPTTINVQLMK